MATIGTAVTYMDLVRRQDFDGKVADIMELQNETNEILTDMMMIECNQIRKWLEPCSMERHLTLKSLLV